MVAVWLTVAGTPSRATRLGLDVVLGPGAAFRAVVTGPAGRAGPGDFRGTVAFEDSDQSLAFAGRASQESKSGNRLAIAASIRYADVPVDWLARFRAAGVALRLEGRVGGSTVVWRGRLDWGDVSIRESDPAASTFVSLTGVEIRSFSPSGSSGVARVRIRNPFAFPLTIASSQYRLEAAGREVGHGATRGILLRPSRASVLDVPLDVDHAGLLAAVGAAAFSTGGAPARLRGWVNLRLSGGDVHIPIDLAGRIRG
jgi:LEA14-like dessication related protein